MAEQTFDEVLTRVDADFAVSLTREIVEIPSVVGEEGPVGDALEAALLRLGAGKVWKEEVEPGRSNVLWEVEALAS